MLEWDRLGADNLAAAKLLLERGHLRSCISRCYYSAYATITGRLIETGHTTSMGGRPNPSHEQIIAMARHNLDRKKFNDKMRRRAARTLKELFRLRVMADYDAENSVEKPDALLSVRNASFVRRHLGVGYGRH